MVGAAFHRVAPLHDPPMPPQKTLVGRHFVAADTNRMPLAPLAPLTGRTYAHTRKKQANNKLITCNQTHTKLTVQ